MRENKIILNTNENGNVSREYKNDNKQNRIKQLAYYVLDISKYPLGLLDCEMVKEFWPKEIEFCFIIKRSFKLKSNSTENSKNGF